MKVSPKKMIVSTAAHVLYTGNIYSATKKEDGRISVRLNETVSIICKEKDLKIIER